MKHYLLIGLLVLSFNANAIDCVLIMAHKDTMPVVIVADGSIVTADLQHSDEQHHHHAQEEDHEHGEDCEQCSACLAHCLGAVINNMSSIDFFPRLTFESAYSLWASLRTFSRLLRPPQSLLIG